MLELSEGFDIIISKYETRGLDYSMWGWILGIIVFLALLYFLEDLNNSLWTKAIHGENIRDKRRISFKKRLTGH